MSEFLSISIKLLVVAAMAPYWYPMIREIIVLVGEAGRDGSDSAPSPIHIERTDGEGAFEENEDTTWNKHRRVNKRWDTGH